MISGAALFAILLAVAVSAVLALCLPARASIGIVLSAVVAVAIGGAALLAKALIAWAAAGAGYWIYRRYARAKAFAGPGGAKLVAIPEPKKARTQAARRHAERRAA